MIAGEKGPYNALAKAVLKGSGWAGCCLCLLLLALPGNAYAQMAGIYVKHLSLGEGLSQGSVNTILQDRHGFMWFATWDGLNRYDGYTFTVYKHQSADSTSLSSSHIRVIHEDSAGMLWVGTDDGGLNQFDPFSGVIRRFNHNPADSSSLDDNWVQAVYEDRSGRLWIGTHTGTLHRLNRTTGHITRYRPDAGALATTSTLGITSLSEDQAGAIWVGTSGQGLLKFDPATETFTPYQHDPANPSSLSNNQVLALYASQHGVLWVGTNGGGLNRFDPTTETFTTYQHDPADPKSLSNNWVQVLYEDRSGTVWAGTNGGGLNRFDPATETFTTYRYDPVNDNGLSSDAISSIYEDRSGVLWVGSAGNGINKIIHSPFSSYRHNPADPTSLSGNYITALLEDRSGAVWIGTGLKGLNKLDTATGNITRYRHDPANLASLCSDEVKSLYEDRQGFLWVGTVSDGLCRFDPATELFEHYRHDPTDSTSLSGENVRVIHEDHAGVFWVGTNGGGLNRFNPDTGTFVHYRHDPEVPTSLSNDAVFALIEDEDGILWVGTSGGGLNRFDPATETFTTYRYSPGDPWSLSEDEVLSLYKDSSDVIWIGLFGGGLNRLDLATETTRHYTEADGLPNNTVYGILPDDQGYLWLSTNLGLTRFNPQTHTFANFDKHDGLKNVEFNVGAYHRGASGRLCFGGIDGVTVFSPEQVVTNPYPPPVALTAFRKSGEIVPLANPPSEIETVPLSYRDAVIGFEFAALDYQAPGKNQYAYQLEGFSDSWTNLGTKRDVMFTNLAPKTYVLRVRASNNNGVWNEEGVSIRLEITPPFWQRWWFRLLATASLALLLLTAYQIRTRTIRRHNRALQSEISERQRAEEALRESEELFRNVFEEGSFGMTIVDLDLRYIKVNAMFCRMMGYTEEELQTRTFAEISHPEDATLDLDLARDLFENKIPFYQIEKRYIHKNGHVLWGKLTATLIRDEEGKPLCGLGMIENISARKHAEQALQESQHHFQTLAENSPSIIFRTNAQGQAVYFNKQWSNITGFPDKSWAGNGWAEALYPADRERVFAGWQEAVKHAKNWQDEFRFQRKDDGSIVWVIGVAVPIYREDGKRGGFIGICTDITERKRTEAALLASEQRVQAQFAELEHLYKTTPVGLCLMDTDLRFVRINEQLAQINGKPIAEHLGKTLHEIIPEIADQVAPTYRQVIETGEPATNFEVQGTTPAAPDDLRSWLVSYYPYLSEAGAIAGVTTVVQDITERKQAERARQTSDQRYRHLYKKTPVMLHSIDPNGRLLSVSDFWLTTLGYERSEVIGRPAIDFLTEASQRYARDVAFPALFETGSVQDVPYQFVKRNGEIIDVLLSAIIEQGPSGEIIRSLAVLTDVTERKQAEEEREALIVDLEQRNAEMERFTYTVSHDLKTPLVTIQGFLGFLERDALKGDSDRMKWDIHQIRTATTTMTRLLEDLLELSRVGRLMNPPEQVALTALAEEAAELVAGPIDQRNVKVMIAPAMPSVYGDRLRLLEVFQNLLENAVKFMGDQTRPCIEVKAAVDQGMVVCSVRDNGVGVKPQYHNKIFGLFERLDQAVEGTGVGLALVRRIIEVHEGRIWIESQGNGSGSTFFFTLPQAAPATNEAAL